MCNEALTPFSLPERDSMAFAGREIWKAGPNPVVTLFEQLKGYAPDHAAHSLRVAKMTRAVSQTIGLTEMETLAATLSALLHDTGKTGIPSAILNNKESLSKPDYALMKTHARIGADMIMEQSGLPLAFRILAADGAASHHMRLGGGGYPARFGDEPIPVMGRFVAPVDTVDAIISDRIYKKGLNLTDAAIAVGNANEFEPVLAGAVIEVMSADNVASLLARPLTLGFAGETLQLA